MKPQKILVAIIAVIGVIASLRFALMHWQPGLAHAMPPIMRGNMMDRSMQGERPWMNDGMCCDNAAHGHMGAMTGKLPALDAASLPESTAQGAKLLTIYCGQCHNLPSPAMHVREDWPTILSRMYRRLDMMDRWASRWMTVKAPSSAEKNVLNEYIAKHSMRRFDAERLSGENSPGAAAFRATCAQCHALPDPTQHSANEWPAVVVRMQANADVMQKRMPDAPTLADITRFLQKYGRHE